MKAVILAAGLGKRLLPYTKESPKPLTRIFEKPILEHIITSLKRAEVEEFVIVTGYLGQAIRGYFGKGSRWNVTIRYVQNSGYHKGNATSLAAAQSLLRDNEVFVLSMADHLMSEYIIEKALKHQHQQPLICVDSTAIQPSRVNDSTKVLVGSDGYVRDIGKAIPSWNGIDTGLFLLNGTIFDVINQMKEMKNPFTLSCCIRQMIKSHKLWACDVSGLFWLDVDTWDDIARAREWAIYET